MWRRETPPSSPLSPRRPTHAIHLQILCSLPSTNLLSSASLLPTPITFPQTNRPTEHPARCHLCRRITTLIGLFCPNRQARWTLRLRRAKRIQNEVQLCRCSPGAEKSSRLTLHGGRNGPNNTASIPCSRLLRQSHRAVPLSTESIALYLTIFFIYFLAWVCARHCMDRNLTCSSYYSLPRRSRSK